MYITLSKFGRYLLHTSQHYQEKNRQFWPQNLLNHLIWHAHNSSKNLFPKTLTRISPDLKKINLLDSLLLCSVVQVYNFQKKNPFSLHFNQRIWTWILLTWKSILTRRSPNLKNFHLALLLCSVVQVNNFQKNISLCFDVTVSKTNVLKIINL